MKSPNISIKEVEVPGFTRSEIPEGNETIANDFNLDELLIISKEISYYYRAPEDCPFNRGNWILDIEFKNGQLMCFKYPKEMTEEQFVAFIKPLLDLIKGKSKYLN